MTIRHQPNLLQFDEVDKLQQASKIDNLQQVCSVFAVCGITRSYKRQ